MFSKGNKVESELEDRYRCATDQDVAQKKAVQQPLLLVIHSIQTGLSFMRWIIEPLRVDIPS